MDFFDKKGKYSLHVLVTVDHDYRVINLVTGGKGPSSDSRVQRMCEWQKQPGEYFSSSQYLLGDKGMLMTPQCVIPYKGQAAAVVENRNFNYQLAKLRVRSEHVIGHTKQRFECLKRLRVQIHHPGHIYRGGDWIVAAFAIHNLCVACGDYTKPTDDRSNISSVPQLDSAQPGFGSEAENVRLVIKRRVLSFMRERETYKD